MIQVSYYNSLPWICGLRFKSFSFLKLLVMKYTSLLKALKLNRIFAIVNYFLNLCVYGELDNWLLLNWFNRKSPTIQTHSVHPPKCNWSRILNSKDALAIDDTVQPKNFSKGNESQRYSLAMYVYDATEPMKTHIKNAPQWDIAQHCRDPQWLKIRRHMIKPSLNKRTDAQDKNNNRIRRN